MKGKKDKKESFRAALIVFGALALTFLLGYIFTELLPKTGHPFFYFLSVLYEDSLCVAIFFFFLLSGVLIPIWKEGGRLEVKGIYRLFFVVAGVWIILVNAFPVKEEYEAVLIKGETPTKFSYKAHILQDVFSGETRVENFSVEKVSAIQNRYYVSGGRGSSGKYYTSCYVRFESEEDGMFASYESPEVWKYVHWMQEHRETIQIEYYVHSGILKSVNGIDKNDSEMLMEELAKLEAEQKRQEELQAEQEALRAEKEKAEWLEAQERATRWWEIMEECVGTDIEVLRERLEAEDFTLSRNIKYISSLHFEVNEIAFWDNEDIYVVKDHSEEQMVQMPKMKNGMTKENVIEALTEAGFTYECDSFSCEMHGKGRLHTIRFGGGKWVPKGYTVWFSIDE